MYKISSKIDLSVFDKKIFLQACFGENELILNFDGGLSIMLMSEIRCVADGKDAKFTDYRSASQAILGLLGKVVTKAEGDVSGALRIFFDNSSYIEIYDDSDQYESFTIQYNQKVIAS